MFRPLSWDSSSNAGAVSMVMNELVENDCDLQSTLGKKATAIAHVRNGLQWWKGGREERREGGREGRVERRECTVRTQYRLHTYVYVHAYTCINTSQLL